MIVKTSRRRSLVLGCAEWSVHPEWNVTSPADRAKLGVGALPCRIMFSKNSCDVSEIAMRGKEVFVCDPGTKAIDPIAGVTSTSGIHMVIVLGESSGQ